MFKKEFTDDIKYARTLLAKKADEQLLTDKIIFFNKIDTIDRSSMNNSRVSIYHIDKAVSNPDKIIKFIIYGKHWLYGCAQQERNKINFLLVDSVSSDKNRRANFSYIDAIKQEILKKYSDKEIIFYHRSP